MHFNRIFKNVSLGGKNPTYKKILKSGFQVDEILDVFHLQVNKVLKHTIFFKVLHVISIIHQNSIVK